MRGPSDPAEESKAAPGEVATAPEDAEGITNIEVTNGNGKVAGLITQWDAAEWFWAEPDSYVDLEDVE